MSYKNNFSIYIIVELSDIKETTFFYATIDLFYLILKKQYKKYSI